MPANDIRIKRSTTERKHKDNISHYSERNPNKYSDIEPIVLENRLQTDAKSWRTPRLDVSNRLENLLSKVKNINSTSKRSSAGSADLSREEGIGRGSETG